MTNILMRDEDGTPLACACRQCGRFCLDTQLEICARCKLGCAVTQWQQEANERLVTAAADRWLRTAEPR